MRVTKLVREYIEESVGKALSEKSIAEKEYEAFYNDLHKFIDEMRDNINHIIDEAIENYRSTNHIPDDVKLEKTNPTLIYYNDWNSVIRNKAEAMKRKRNEAKEKATKDIMLTLELGGTKADLDAMLSKVATEYKI